MNCPVCGRYGEPDPFTGYDGADLCPDCKAGELKATVALTCFEPAPITQCRELRIGPERCLNPLCQQPLEPRRKHAPRKFYCSPKCAQDASVIRRASRLLAGVSWETAVKALAIDRTQP